MFPLTGSAVGGTLLTIQGTGFANGVTVALNGSPAQVRSTTSHSISVLTPAATRGGAVDVVVTNPDGQNARLPDGFTYFVIERPSIRHVSASPGSTGGGAEFRIAGTGFQPRAAVDFGGVSVVASLVEGELLGMTPAHPAGTVDVTVTNPDGQADTLPNAYTYVEPASLDFNGEWQGYGTEGETTLTFTIRNNLLIQVSCGPSLEAPPTVIIGLSPAPSVNNGTVFFAGSDGLFTGRIVTGTSSEGRLRIDRCFAREVPWFAQKR